MRVVGISQRQLGRPRKGKPSCADCFFHCNQLCALDLDAPCSTYRKNTPSGLVPPRQHELLVREQAERAAA